LVQFAAGSDLTYYYLRFLASLAFLGLAFANYFYFELSLFGIPTSWPIVLAVVLTVGAAQRLGLAAFESEERRE